MKFSKKMALLRLESEDGEIETVDKNVRWMKSGRFIIIMGTLTPPQRKYKP
jgi:hypothetical protein